VANGQVFALGYAAAFAILGRAEWWIGALFGAWHGLAALVVIVPLASGAHPRMATDRSGPELHAVLEPPGLLALNYGRETPIVALVAHIIFGAILGTFLSP
jgi:uncharacterized membrane protein YagU involved in acid resistance